MQASLVILIISVFIILLNIPFGFWRANVRRFSFQWYLAIHLPVPIIILMRIILDIGWHWSTYVAFILSFSLGQYLGGLLQKRYLRKYPEGISSCLCIMLFKRILLGTALLLGFTSILGFVSSLFLVMLVPLMTLFLCLKSYEKQWLTSGIFLDGLVEGNFLIAGMIVLL